MWPFMAIFKVRVWLRESSLGAASVARLVDHGNGSYTATLKAFWIGQPEVRVSIISPREVIAAAFKRRYDVTCDVSYTFRSVF